MGRETRQATSSPHSSGVGSGEEKGAKRGPTANATPFVPPSPRLWKILAAGGEVQGEVQFFVYLSKQHKISALGCMGKNLGGGSTLPNVVGNTSEVGETWVYPGW